MKKLKHFFPQILSETGDSDSKLIPGVASELQNISLDQKVDKYFIQYERESLPGDSQFGATSMPQQPASPAPQMEQKSSGKKTLKEFFKIVLEADEPPPDLGGGLDAGAPGDLGGAPPGGDPGGFGGEPSPPAEPEQPAIKPGTINIQNFAKNIARLIGNYETLCDPRTTILNRARAYVLKNYNENTAKELVIILEEQYGLSASTNPTPDAGGGPMAIGAWSAGAGGGGGGVE